ncbi:hypothetical protein HJG60_011143 [Phyllostomus discolor]|uniref:Uncharacterized protein n=1 Tax=Phyllostomus discolor TaxID=89673 RepID=A0A834A208_9CHIR|nr:hypothetical protein HJG60_011143 [Phyllostomus discolor]
MTGTDPRTPFLCSAVISSQLRAVVWPRVDGPHTRGESPPARPWLQQSVGAVSAATRLPPFPHPTGSSACSCTSPPAPEYIFYLDVTITTQIGECVSPRHLCFQLVIDVPFGRRLLAHFPRPSAGATRKPPSTPQTLRAQPPPSDSASPSLNVTLQMSDVSWLSRLHICH